MPKVLRIINRFNLGGPTYNVSYLTKYLNNGYETLLVGGMNDKNEACSDYIAKKLGIHFLKIPEMTRDIGYNDLVAYYKIKDIIRRYKPDIVHTHASKSGFLGRRAAAELKVPVIVHTFHGHIFHSYFNNHTTRVFKAIERQLAQKTDAIVAISNLQKYELSKVYKIAPEEKFRVIPLGFDLERFQENYDFKRKTFRDLYHVKDDEIVITIIGRLVPVKNHELFIKAVAEVKKNTNRKVKAFIVGDGELKSKLLELANSVGLKCFQPGSTNYDADIFFTSWIQDADLVLAATDITALTSFNEGTPVSLIEAQAANSPIVCTNVGGIEDVVIKDKTALLAGNNNLQDFSHKLLTLVNSDAQRNEMKKHGWEFVKETFHYTRLVRDTKNLYDELLRRKKI